jgi:photosystem II stability/assembly factor-like uncharacterized protein
VEKAVKQMEQTLLVGTTDGLHEIPGKGKIDFAGQEVRSLAKSDSGWWAIIGRREVWRYDTGSRWVQAGSVHEKLRANCLLPTTSQVFIGTSDAGLFTLRDQSLEEVHSFNSAPGRENWYTPWGGPADVRSLSENAAGMIYVNVHVGGIVRSADGGMTWEPTIDIDSDVHQVYCDRETRLLLAPSASGLAVSDDNGASWKYYTEGLHGTYLRAVAVTGGMIFVTASTGPRTSMAAVYRKSLHDMMHFEQCQQGLPQWFSHNIDTFCITSSGSSVVFGTSEGTLYLSSDEGQSWTLAAEGLPSIRCVAFRD